MANLFGIRDPRLRFGAVPVQQQANQGRVTIPRQGEPVNQQGGMGGFGYQSPSQGLFSAYMSQLFNQRYLPPAIQGLFGQYPGGYSGFMSPTMPRVQSPPNPGLTGQTMNGLPVWDYRQGGKEPSGTYYTPFDPNNLP